MSGDPDFEDNKDLNLLVPEDGSSVYVTFISEGTVKNNTLLFFTYPVGAAPTSAPALSQENVVFSATEGLAQGTRVKLGTFNRGTRGGWVIIPGGGTTSPPDLWRWQGRYLPLPEVDLRGRHVPVHRCLVPA